MVIVFLVLPQGTVRVLFTIPTTTTTTSGQTTCQGRYHYFPHATKTRFPQTRKPMSPFEPTSLHPRRIFHHLIHHFPYTALPGNLIPLTYSLRRSLRCRDNPGHPRFPRLFRRRGRRRRFFRFRLSFCRRRRDRLDRGHLLRRFPPSPAGIDTVRGVRSRRGPRRRSRWIV